MLKSSRVGLLRRFEFLHDLNDSSATLDGVVEMKNQMRRVFQYDVTRQFRLQRDTVILQLGHYLAGTFLPKNAHEHVSIFEVRRNIHMVNGDDRRFEANLADYDCA